jgi:hypothetical protein
MLGVSGVTVVTMLVCFYHFAHKAAGASGARHSLRPLMFRGATSIAKLARKARRDCEAVSHRHCEGDYPGLGWTSLVPEYPSRDTISRGGNDMFFDGIKYAAKGSVSRAGAWAPLPGACLVWLGLWLMGYQIAAPETWEQIIAAFLLCAGAAWAIIFVGRLLYWPYCEVRILRRRIRPAADSLSLGYLSNEDSELGAAIRNMAWRSAWARWYASQSLGVDNRSPTSEAHIMSVATSNVADAMIDGRLEVRGRKPGQLDYEPIDRTHWRSTGLHMVPDSRSMWRMILIPAGGAEFCPDGTVVGRDPAAVQRTDQLAVYDSLIVNSRQFEKLWPREDKEIDAVTQRLQKKAKKAGADPAEIAKLSRE